METVIGHRRFEWGTRTFVMGIVNVTPDSFSGDGLLASDPDPDTVTAALAQVRQMVDEGADILDVGGESTRPGHAAVTDDEEARASHPGRRGDPRRSARHSDFHRYDQARPLPKPPSTPARI